MLALYEDKNTILTVKLGFIIAILTALLSPIWYFLALEVTNGRVWLVGYLILFGLWIAQFITNTYYKKWTKKHYLVQAVVGLLCFLPFSSTALTFLAWATGGFAP
jgi:hypothetical protein